MKTKFTMILTLFMALIVQVTFAQQQTVSGTVSDENGLPLIGATVVISGTSSGTTTDFDGNYRTNARQGEVLNFSYVGYESQNITVSISNTVNVSLQPD
ncbi:carboxypeptidase-like regulatory domain-containing protein, partial [Flavobacteriaceae bacterium]|nr:carboxypeptidase-like regulatory domain-containing protein [Flavobacteriaceae bacterium]